MSFCPFFRAMYHAANGRWWDIDSPLVRSAGVWVRGGCTVSTLVLEEGTSSETGLENVLKCPKKGSKFGKKIGISKLAPAYGCSGNASSGL